jgi:RNA polymerase sigma-70 factor (ECF subfamily)
MSGKKSDDADAQSGWPDSIEALYTAQESALLRYARSLMNHDEAAQDIVQEAFLRLHADFESVRQPQAWLYRTVHNLAMNHIRADHRTVPLEAEAFHQDALPDGQSLPDEQIEHIEAVGQTRLCLDGLHARQRELIRLKFEDGLSYKEISARMNLSISNVGYLLHHALKDLAEALRKAGVMS